MGKSGLDFSWDDYFWVTKADLESWRIFSSGPVGITFAPEGRDESSLSDSEKELVDWVVHHEKEILESLLYALLREYPRIREEFSGYIDRDEVAELLPQISSHDELRKLISHPSINVHQLASSKAPYFGVQFGCSWDEEHGLGILMRKTEVLEIGGADTAILLWLAKKYETKG